MKKILTLLLFALLVPVCIQAKNQAEIKFNESSYNFGTVQEKGGKISHTFTFTNAGNENLLILDASASCGCTVPEYPQQPIAPGKTGVIKVTYDPKFRPGPFTKTITIRTNGKPKKAVLKISGVVK